MKIGYQFNFKRFLISFCIGMPFGLAIVYLVPVLQEKLELSWLCAYILIIFTAALLGILVAVLRVVFSKNDTK